MIDIVFKAVSLIFAASAIATGLHGVLDPVGFARSFGLPVAGADQLARAYVSLMGVRQLGTGLTIALLAHQGLWPAIATLLATIGFVVAGSDGIFLARSGALRLGLFHAIPGAAIAILSLAALKEGSAGKV